VAALATAVAVVLTGAVSPLPAAAAVDAGPAAATDPGLRWKVTAAPFRLAFLRHSRPLIAQATGDPAGPGGRMAYALADGTTHRLTDLVRSTRGRDATTYTVATDEPARTAQVTVRTTARGLRVEWRLAPATGITQVYEALTGVHLAMAQ